LADERDSTRVVLKVVSMVVLKVDWMDETSVVMLVDEMVVLTVV